MRFKDDNGWEWTVVLLTSVGVVLGAAVFAWTWWDFSVTAIYNYHNQ